MIEYKYIEALQRLRESLWRRADDLRERGKVQEAYDVYYQATGVSMAISTLQNYCLEVHAK